MKNTILFLAVLLTYFTATSQVRITDMSTFNGNAENAYVPVVINGVNYKTLAKNFVAGKVDSLTYKYASASNPDTIYSWAAGIRKQIGLVSKTLTGTVATDSTLVGDGSPGAPLSLNVLPATITTVGNIAARDSIPGPLRYEGMIVYVTLDQKYYSLKGGTGNPNWVETVTGGTTIISSGSGVFTAEF